MHKATMCLLVVLSLWGATSWRPPQTVPQWTVVAERHFVGEKDFNFLTVLDPQNNGPYRFSGVCSVRGVDNSTWTFTVSWTDVSGHGAFTSVQCMAGQYNSAQQVVFMFLPRLLDTVTLSASVSGAASTYDAAFTIEQLQ